MSHARDQFFEYRLDQVQADFDDSEAYYRQKEADEAQEREYRDMLDADEALEAWLNSEIEMANAPDHTDWLAAYKDADYVARAEAAYKAFQAASAELQEAMEKLRAMNDFVTLKTDAA